VDEAMAVVRVTVAGNTYTATNNSDGTWTLADNTIRPALPDGLYDVSVSATDPAGNVTTDKTLRELRIDAVAPTVTVNTLITKDVQPALTGTVNDAAAVVSVTVEGNTYAAVNSGKGTWTLAGNTISALDDGVYNVSVAATDAAGNVGRDETAKELTIDTLPPTVSVDTLTTMDTRPPLTGRVDDRTAVVKVTIGRKTYTATNNGDGTWTLADNTIKPALALGVYDVLVTATDGVGNVGTDTTTNELTIGSRVTALASNAVSMDGLQPQSTQMMNGVAAAATVIGTRNARMATADEDRMPTSADKKIGPALAARALMIQRLMGS